MVQWHARDNAAAHARHAMASERSAPPSKRSLPRSPRWRHDQHALQVQPLVQEQATQASRREIVSLPLRSSSSSEGGDSGGWNGAPRSMAARAAGECAARRARGGGQQRLAARVCSKLAHGGACNLDNRNMKKTKKNEGRRGIECVWGKTESLYLMASCFILFCCLHGSISSVYSNIYIFSFPTDL